MLLSSSKSQDFEKFNFFVNWSTRGVVHSREPNSSLLSPEYFFVHIPPVIFGTVHMCMS